MGDCCIPMKKLKPNSRASHSPRLRPYQPKDIPNLATPFVEIEGVKFFSDRFYLNAPTGLPYYDYNKNGSESKDERRRNKQAPPLFDRARLVKSLDLKVAILGTYTVDIDWISKEMPSLFPPFSVDEEDAKDQNFMIPTLLLHGHQGLKNELLRKQKAKERRKRRESKLEKTKNEIASTVKEESDDEIQIIKQITPPNDSTSSAKKRKRKRKSPSIEEIAKKLGKKVFREPDFHESAGKRNTQKSIVHVVKSEESDTIHSFQAKRSYTLRKETLEEKKWKDKLQMFGSSVHVTQILPRWIPPKGAKSIEKQFETAKENETEKKRCMGTYHPKFMLLFEKSGSIVVVVSTGNLTRPRAVDGTWLQRFYPEDPTSQKKKQIMKGSCDGSDFGHVLCDFLQKQSDVAENNAMTPTEFLRKHLGISSLLELQQKYAFEKASVHLVSTVPGSHPGRFGAQHLSKISGVEDGQYNRRIFYGSQRISDIMHKCTHRFNPWLPSKYLSNSDKLIVQTTSFGSKWNRETMEKLVKQYMSIEERNQVPSEDVLRNLYIVWPTKKLMENIQNEIDQNCQSYDKEENVSEHFAFLSSETFNTIDETCIARMTKYENNLGLLPHVASPHIKSYGRTMNRKDLPHKSNQKEICLAWFMLTSACLSRGAQGCAEREQRFQGLDENNYLNFELGILFCSRLQGNSSTDRLYKSYSNASSSTDDEDHNSITLPVPFQMNSELYQKFEDIPDFDEDPFFHEVTESTAIGKNMGFTPIGMKIRRENSN